MLVAFGSASAERIRIGVTNYNLTYLSSGVALKRGFFRAEGLDAEIIRMTPDVSVMAITGGDIDYSMLFGLVVRSAVRGLPVRVVANFMDSSPLALIARPQFKSVKDLKGKTLGVSTFGATPEIAARMVFKEAGIDAEREIKVVALRTDDARMAALKEGIVDVIVIAPPADVEMRKQGFNVVARVDEVFKFPYVGLGANVRKIKERPDEVKRTVKAMIRANRYIRENREGTIQVLNEWGGIKPDNAAATYDSSWKVFNPDGTISQDGLRLVIEQAKREMKVTRDIALDDVSDTSALRAAQAELGLKAR
ncbi:MAG TPA: ABC transporter substrate-binding protein [Candidatus Binatia bacterium]|nr:ABC transporter substrate-binding protein [Candidatus Binatia bacterium]